MKIRSICVGLYLDETSLVAGLGETASMLFRAKAVLELLRDRYTQVIFDNCMFYACVYNCIYKCTCKFICVSV